MPLEDIKNLLEQIRTPQFLKPVAGEFLLKKEPDKEEPKVAVKTDDIKLTGGQFTRVPYEEQPEATQELTKPWDYSLKHIWRGPVYEREWMDMFYGAEKPKPLKEGWVQDNLVDPLQMGAIRMAHNTKQWITKDLPSMILAPPEEPFAISLHKAMGAEERLEAKPYTKEFEAREEFKEIAPEEKKEYYTEKREHQTKQIRKEAVRKYFRKKAEQADRDLHAYIARSPELQLREDYAGPVIETVKENPSILLEPGYWVFQAARTGAYTGGALGTAMLVSSITGNPLTGSLAAMGVTAPSLSRDIRSTTYNALTDKGMSKDDADVISNQIGLVVGPVLAGVEVAGDLPVLASFSKPFKKALNKGIIKTVTNYLANHAIARGATRLSAIEIAEILEEGVQGLITRATTDVVTENKGLLQSMVDYIKEEGAETAVHTAMATLPLGLAGAGVDIRRITPKMGLTIEEVGEGKEQPQIPKELEPLTKEARKYESAEEFVEKGIKPFHSIKEKDLDKIIKKDKKVISPSIGIGKNIEKIKDYGDIALVPSKDILKKTPFYTRDIWSATLGQVPDKIYKVDESSKAFQVLQEYTSIDRNAIEESKGRNNPREHFERYFLRNDYALSQKDTLISIAKKLDWEYIPYEDLKEFNKEEIQSLKKEDKILTEDEDGFLNEDDMLELEESISRQIFPEIKKTPDNISNWLKENYEEEVGVGSLFPGAQYAAEKFDYQDLQNFIDRLAEKKIDTKKLFEAQEEAKRKAAIELGIIDKAKEGFLGSEEYERFRTEFPDEVVGQLSKMTDAEEAIKKMPFLEEYKPKDINKAIKILKKAYIDIPTEYFEGKIFETLSLNDFPVIITQNKSAISKLKDANYSGKIYNTYKDLYNKAVGKPAEVEPEVEGKVPAFKEPRITKKGIMEEAGKAEAEKIARPEGVLLRERMRAEVRGAKKGKRTGKKEMKAKLKPKYKEKISKLTKEAVAKRKEIKNAFREKIKTAGDIRQMIKGYAMKELPLRERGKLLAKIKNAKKYEDLGDAIDYIDKLGRLAEARGLITKIRKKIKPTKVRGKKPKGKYTPAIQKELDTIYPLVKLSQKKALERLESNLEKHTEDMPAEIAKENTILDLFTGNIEQRQTLLNAINQLKEEGSVANALKKFNIQEELNRKQNLVVDRVTGGQGIEQGRLRGEPIKKTTGRKIKQFFKAVGKKMVLDWQGLMELSDFNSSVKGKPLGSHFSVLKQENQYKKRQRQYKDDFNEAVSSIYGVKNKPNSILKQVNKLSQEEVTVDDIKMTRDELIKRWMEIQDPTLEDSFRQANKYTDKTFKAIKDTMTPQDKKFAQWQLDYYQKLYPKINEIYSKMYGVNLPFNEFYSPIRRRGFQLKPGHTEFLEEAFYRKAVTNKSLYSRVKNLLPIERQSSLSILDQHITDMNYYISWAEKIREFDSVFTNPKVREAYKQEFPKKVLNAIDNKIQDMATHGNKTARRVGWVDWFRNHFVVGNLAVKPALAAKQLVSTMAYAEKTGFVGLTQGLLDFVKHPLESYKTLQKESVFIKERGAGMERDIRSAIKEGVFKRYKKSQNLANTLLTFIKLGDKGAIILGSWAMRHKGLKQGKNLTDVINEYEEFSAQTQQSADISRLSEVQLGGSLTKLFTMFKSSQRAYFQKELNAIKSLFREGGHTRSNITKVAKTMFIYHTLLPVMFQFVANLGGWDEKDRKEYLRAALLGSFNGVFIAGDMIDGILRQALGMHVWSMEAPVVTVANDVNKVLRNLTGDDITTQDFYDAIDGLASSATGLTGLPIEYATDATESLIKGQYERALKQILGWSEYYLEEPTPKYQPIKSRAKQSPRERMSKYKTKKRDMSDYRR